MKKAPEIPAAYAAVSNYLGVRPDQIIELQQEMLGAPGGSPGLKVTLFIPSPQGADQFIQEHGTPPFKEGNIVAAKNSFLAPRGGEDREAIRNHQHRTVTSLKYEGRKWWVYVRGIAKPFNAAMLSLIPAYSRNPKKAEPRAK